MAFPDEPEPDFSDVKSGSPSSAKACTATSMRLWGTRRETRR